ncbi:hypothetical protein HYE67_001031 [Fusarium culmorum]|uniref:MalT-like TPR region domain-containing protein n=1 Tax=Fusarium culmorum TaxID=5516 RepID=A0A2T4GLQ7_FUSCU|nr:hypothetical protein FCULG_00002680 [Fusarium culmorum]QPC58800.1 hypothetical protein HYE67_001031 [Fusarium culmorum]
MELPAWRASALEAASQSLFDESSNRSEDASVLLVLLSFFSHCEKIPLDLFVRGSTPRKRWTVEGNIEFANATRVGLASELVDLLSDAQRLTRAFDELCQSAAVLRYPDETYHLNEDMSARVHRSLVPDTLPFWRQQALVVAYRAIPWKYIEFPDPVVRSFLPHLHHVAEAFQDCFEELPRATRTDFMLTLIEAFRFPDMAWKYFAIGQAELAAGRLKDTHLRLCIGQTKAVLGRLSGNMDEAVSSLQDIVSNDPAASASKRVRCEVGVAIIQRSLNCIQVADLSTAQKLLEDWDPYDAEPSPLETILSFRKYSLLGRVMRLQGNFEKALELLKTAHQASQITGELVFDEDLRDLTCDLADTLRELNEPVAGESYLRTEITRRTERPDPLQGKSLLELALAEALFAQERYGEAKEVCVDIESRASLLKYERLRVNVILAKLSHTRSDFEAALSRWSEAMQALQEFSLVDGQVQNIISASMADVLDAQGHNWLTKESPRKASLTELAKPEGVPHWIAGFRQWADYLQSKGTG